MTRTDLLLAIVDLARTGHALPPEDAISHVAAIVHGLDTTNPDAERVAEALLRIGACVWDLRAQQLQMEL